MGRTGRPHVVVPPEPRPNCDCHGRPMRWNTKRSLPKGGYWRCGELHRATQKAWRDANKDRLRDYMTGWRDQNRDHMRQSAAAWRAANPKRWRPRVLMQKYGITLDDYRDMLVGQAGRCLICLRVPDTDLVVDHDHATGKVRGLLCQKCNRMLGHAHDRPAVFRSAIRYLEGAA